MKKPNPAIRREVIEEVALERLRQITKEDWSAAHDDTHVDRELARMGAAYVLQYVHRAGVIEAGMEYKTDCGAGEYVPDDWKFNPKNPRRDLIRSAALIIAEIERLDRALQSAKSREPQ